MEAIRCPSAALPFHSFLNHHPAQPRRSAQLLLPTRPHKQRHPPRFCPLSRMQAVNNALSVAANSPAAAGDISVLIPISALLIFIYWMANFVVPEMITKDFQPTASDGKKPYGEEPNSSEDNYPTMSSEAKLKIKKGSIKKMTRTP